MGNDQVYSALALMCMLRQHKKKKYLLEYLETDRKNYITDILRQYLITNKPIEVLVSSHLRRETAVISRLIMKATSFPESVIHSLAGRSPSDLIDIDWLLIPELTITGKGLTALKSKNTIIEIRSDPLSYDQAVSFVKGL